MEKHTGEKLIEELVSKPDSFFKYGKSNDLLQEYFRGFDLMTLIPLLENEDEKIIKPTIWIVSELGEKACGLLQYVVPLLNCKDKYIRYYASESILLCAKGERAKQFVYLVNGLDDPDSTIRKLTMKLLSNAEKKQLLVALESITELHTDGYDLHRNGLNKLLDIETLSTDDVKSMINNGHIIIQRYGAMIAGKKQDSHPELIEYALSSDNSEIMEFAEMMIELR